MITSRTTRTEVRYAQVSGSGGVTGNAVTLGDLEALVLAAKSEGVPPDTVVIAPALFGGSSVSTLEVKATVGEDGD